MQPFYILSLLIDNPRLFEERLIIKAKLKGIIPSIKPILEKIKQTDFRISIELELQALKEAAE